MNRKNWMTLALAASLTSQVLAATTAPVAVQKTNDERAKSAKAKRRNTIARKSAPDASLVSVAPTAVVPVNGKQVQPQGQSAVQSSVQSQPGRAQSASKAAVLPTTTRVSAARKKPVLDHVQTPYSSATSSARVIQPNGVTISKAPKIDAPQKVQPWIVGLNNYYTGSAMVEPFAGYQPDPGTGYDMGATELVTHGVLGYRLNSNWSVSLNPQFSTSPNYHEYDNDSGSYKASSGSTFKPIGSFIRLSAGSFISTKTFSWNGDFRYYAPLTADMRGDTDPESGMKLGLFHTLRTGQNLSFTLSPKLTFDIANILRFYGRPNGYQPDGNKPALMLFKVESIPGFTYRFADNLTASLAFDMIASHQYGRAFSSWDNVGTYLQPGIAWDVTKGLTFAPYVMVRTANSVSQNTTQWAFDLIWSIL
ncbi:MAG: hypothetical protein EOP09_00775 [Proteobacteria bacterium]|nr:MAG: hypothetical protein EOP09_00775 [Pseudomonadota bacterium]